MITLLLATALAFASPVSDLHAFVKQTEAKYGAPKSPTKFSVDGSEPMHVSCPTTLICPSENYALAYTATRPDITLRVAFDLKTVRGLTFALLQKHFELISFQLRFPTNGGWVVKNSIGDGEEVVRKEMKGACGLTSFDGHRLKGWVKTKLTSLMVEPTNKWAEENCNWSENNPEGCFGLAKVSLPVEISFDVGLDQEPLDCRDRDAKNLGCGH